MEGHRRYILAVIWLCVLYVIGILLFTQGFLLSRAVVSHNNTCRVDFAGQAHNHLKDRHGFDGCWMHARFKKAVILIIDALRFDFVAHQELVGGSERPFQNKLVSINKLLDKQPMNSRLYRFIADPPTTTMQRLKGLTTGSLPTFVDASANFASAEISEDNIIQQMENQGKRVVFTGDDTWMGLYPTQFLKSFPFPSLNVKDLHTVDNGVIAHLNEELQQKDEWDILIGHTLGVDHCGHTYGPDHPIMEQKLKQMNDLINNLTKAVDDDTVLMVFGDHGMTKTGDHGGDSKDELNSALFVYSKSQITSTPPQKGQYPQVSQIDLVPTLSLLLGLPIPHSNLGSVVVDMFNHCPWWKTEANPERQLYHAIEALHLNAHQVHDYLLSYNEISSELPLHEYSRLDAIFRGTETELQSLMVALHHGHDSHNIQSRLKKLTENYMHYLSGVKEMCEGIWAKFNVSSMVLGLIVTLTAVVVHIIMFAYRQTDDSFCLLSSLAVGTWVSLTCIFLSFLQLTARQLAISVFMSGLSIGTIAFILIKVLSSNPNKPPEQLWQPSAINFLSVCSSILMVFYAGSLFSNSYVVNEDSVTAFLFQSLLVLHAYDTVKSLIRKSDKMQQISKMMKSNTGFSKKKAKVAFDFFWPLTSSSSLLCILVCIAACFIRISHVFRACREEQLSCESPSLLRSLSTLSGITASQRNIRYFLSVVMVASVPITWQWWLRRHGNLTGFSPGVLWLSYGLPSCAVCLCFSWALQALPQNLYQALSPAQIVALPRVLYGLSLVSLAIFLVQPLCIFLLPQEEDSLPMGENQDNVIPRAYNYLKVNWRRHLRSLPITSDSEERPPVVYGLATVYSSSQLLLLSSVVFILYLLLGDGLAPSLTLQMGVMYLVLEIWAASVKMSKLRDGAVNWSFIVLWGLLCSERFFSTGHHATITAIRWEAAFNGFQGDFSSNLIPALLIGINTYASYILGAIGLPLLLFWPYVQGKLCFAFEKAPLEENQRGEFLLNEEPERLHRPLFRLFIGFLLFFAIKLLFCMACAALHRRHLMVWKIFAPRFIYEGLTFLVMSMLCVLVYCAVVRVDGALNKWTDRIRKSQSS